MSVLRKPNCAEAPAASDMPPRTLDAHERRVIEKMLDQCSGYAVCDDERAELASVIERIGLNMTQAYLHKIPKD
ncbi:hypothetical protein [Celeribacter sp.]|uniref:hypothetical protein n=1 Tax=Celeribacter sp. TaxID=1890673 RepID=UPI003A9300E9